MLLTKRAFYVSFAVIAGATAWAQAAPGAADPVHARGTAAIRSNQYETMVTVRTADGDGPADHVFHLWSRPALPLDGGWRNVQIEYSGTALVLTFPETKRVIAFTVAGAATLPVVTPEGFASTGYTVAGISHEIAEGAARHSVRSGSPQPYDSCNCDEAGFQQPDPWDYGAGGTSCTSGGVFSSSCSQSGSGGSCSVTCGTGTYACCVAGNPPTCTCKATL